VDEILENKSETEQPSQSCTCHHYVQCTHKIMESRIYKRVQPLHLNIAPETSLNFILLQVTH